MVTIFNRRDVSMTFDVNKLAMIREVLAINGIEYKIKSINHNHGFQSRPRVRKWDFGIHIEYGREYIVYVKKKDYREAKELLA